MIGATSLRFWSSSRNLCFEGPPPSARGAWRPPRRVRARRSISWRPEHDDAPSPRRSPNAHTVSGGSPLLSRRATRAAHMLCRVGGVLGGTRGAARADPTLLLAQPRRADLPVYLPRAARDRRCSMTASIAQCSHRCHSLSGLSRQSQRPDSEQGQVSRPAEQRPGRGQWSRPQSEHRVGLPITGCLRLVPN